MRLCWWSVRVSSSATPLARAESLTALVRSAHSRVSLVARLSRLRGHPHLPPQISNCAPGHPHSAIRVAEAGAVRITRREADGLGIGALRRARETRVKLVVNELDLFRRSVRCRNAPSRSR